MWMLKNNTPYAAERGWVRDMDGGEVWLVAVRATYDIHSDGSLTLAEAQTPVELAPRYAGEPGKSGLWCESDLVHQKSATDVLLHGHAYAPSGSAKQVDVRMKVGPIDKTIRVFGDRWWDRGLVGGVALSAPQPFEKMPLTWERAFGGVDDHDPKRIQYEPRNPIGRGFARDPKIVRDQPAPNLEDPRKRLSSPKDRPDPMNFGPIPGDWKPRVDYAGTYDDVWMEERRPLPPKDFDPRFHQCAPADQQVQDFLKGGELVRLENLSPVGTLQFELPKLSFEWVTDFDGGERIRHRGDLHTVLLEPDHPRLTLVWHSALPCHHQYTRLKHTTIVEKRRVTLGQPLGAAS